MPHHITTLCLLLAGGMAASCDRREASRPSVLALAAAAVEQPAAVVTAPVWTETRLVAIPTGTYQPLFAGKGEAENVSVEPFLLEEHAVTNEQFLAFVFEHPQWRRSVVVELFADAGYLSHWPDDLDHGPSAGDRPVTHVSWFAARAYAQWIGRRLPTLAEWEAVAAADETERRGRDNPAFVQRILDWYGRPTPAVPQPVRSTFRNVHGAWDMHGLVWEWIEDFNSALVTGESRGDSGLERNLFCGSGSVGAADPSDYAAFMRFAFRSSLRASYTVKNLGFRCAADVELQGEAKR